MKFRESLVGLAACVALAACTGPISDAQVGSDTKKIVGGSETSGDPSVVMLFSYGRGGGGTCTGSVIAPRAVLTAAHCVEATDASYVIYNGLSIDSAQFSDLIRAREAIPHPDFNIDDIGGGNDVGLLIFDKDIVDKNGTPYEPLPWLRRPVSDDMIEQPVRLVGYGVTSGDENAYDSGIKRETSTVLSEYDDMFLGFLDTEHNMCSGDSGGPVLMTIDGVETVIGVNSFVTADFGGNYCENGGYSSRPDLFVDWIDGIIEEKTGWIHPSKRPTKVTGDECAAAKECVGGYCIADAKTGLSYCSTACDPKAATPAGYVCEDDGNGATILVKGTKKKKGCDMTGGADASAFGLLFFAAIAVARRRRLA